MYLKMFQNNLCIHMPFVEINVGDLFTNRNIELNSNMSLLLLDLK